MTLEELLAVAEIVEKLTNRYRDQEAAHKAALTEIRASFNARTSADGKLIEGRRMEIIRLNGANDRLNDLLRAERLAHRDEVAALQERLRASIARGDFAQMEVTAPQTPKHPVKVGEWVRRTKLPGAQSPVGIVKQVTLIRCDGDSYGFADGDFWSVDNCEPCDPPQTAPAPKRAHPVAVGGYLRRLTGFNTTPAGEVARVTLVDDADPSQLEYEVVRPNGQKGRWSATGCEPCDSPEATHDTEAGKAAAESAVRTEPVAEEIKVGDLVEVVSHTGRNTWLADVGSVGTVVTVEEINDSISVHLEHVPGKKNALAGYVSFCDVRKVTT